MKVLLLNPPFLPKFSRSSRSPAVTKSATLYYPILMAYATGVLEEDGFETLLIDAPAMEMDHNAVYQKANDFSPILTVIDTSTPSIENDVKIAENIKKATGCQICLVGTHVSALPEETLDMSTAIDFAAIHEYDYTVRDIARLLRRTKTPIEGEVNSIGGIAFRTGEVIRRTQKRRFIENLDNIPFVSRVYSKYLAQCIPSYFYGSTQHPVMTILTGRGCPYGCSYCVYPQTMTGHTYRMRSVSNVVDELEFIQNSFPEIKEIFMEDDTLTVHKERCFSLAKEIIRRDLHITWTTNSRADVDLETLKILKKAGLRLLCVGFESGDQTVLDNLGKRLSTEQMIAFSKNTKKAGILVHGCFLVGSEGETKATLKKTLDMAIRINPDTAQFYPIMVYPGTRAYNWANSKNYITAKGWREWLTAEGLHNSVVSTPDLSAKDLVEFCDVARRKFYLRPRYLLGKALQIIKQPREAKRIVKSSKTFFRYLLKGSDI